MRMLKFSLIFVSLTFFALSFTGGVLSQEDFTYFELGMFNWRQGDHITAIDNFLKAIEEDPSKAEAYYNLALVYEEIGEYFRAYYMWKEYLSLKPDKYWAAKAEKHITELKATGKVYFEGVKFDQVKIDSLFPSIYKYYATHPIGFVVVKNRAENPVRDLKISFFVKEYMDFPTETVPIESLKPEETAEIDLYASFNHKILQITEDTPIISSINLYYIEGEERKEESRTDTFTLYNRNAMTWNPQEKIASFVTPKDPTIRLLTRSIVQMYKDERVDYVHESLQKAMQIFDALGTYGMAYVEDPKTPYKEISETADVVDYIQYPVDTYRLKTGDCDDGVVLYAAMLESIGIPSALVDFPGHVYPMFDTGLPISKAQMITGNTNLYIPHKGHIWIPVETTLWGKSFTEAWHNAADRYYRTPSSKRRIIEMEEAWKEYNPVTLIGVELTPTLPPKTDIDQLLSKDLQEQHQSKMNFISKNYARLISADEVNYKAHNELGIIYAKNLLFDEAAKQFKKALGVKPDFAKARINLGYAYYKKKMVEEAIEEFSKVEPKNARLNYNIGVLYYREREYDKAREYLESASKLDPGYKKKFEFIALKESKGRASEAEAALPEIEILWME